MRVNKLVHSEFVCFASTLRPGEVVVASSFGME